MNEIIILAVTTSMGNFDIELYPKEAPITVENFVEYVDDNFFENVLFHRIIPGFVIQGGGFEIGMNQKPTKDPIKNESDNGLKNEKYTLSMARTNELDSATSQFFINSVSYTHLRHRLSMQILLLLILQSSQVFRVCFQMLLVQILVTRDSIY